MVLSLDVCLMLHFLLFFFSYFEIYPNGVLDYPKIIDRLSLYYIRSVGSIILQQYSYHWINPEKYAKLRKKCKMVYN